MTVTGRQNLDAVLGEQALNVSGNFSDEDYISMGHLASARYILTRTPQGYMLDLGVTETRKAGSGRHLTRRNCGPSRICGT
jgi:hypothetical protein